MASRPIGDPRRRLGRRGELLAERYLEGRGLSVVERNFRVREGELDLVLAGPNVLVFCEVKTRVAGRSRSGPAAGPDPFSPLESVGIAKQRRLRKLAAIWLARRSERSGAAPAGRRDLRFDVVGVVLSPAGALLRLDHAENAF